MSSAWCGPSKKSSRARRIRSSCTHIFRAHCETFVLILPSDGGVKIEQFWSELIAVFEQIFFRFDGCSFEVFIIVLRDTFTVFLPMRDGVNFIVLFRLLNELRLNLNRQVFRKNAGLSAVFANQPNVGDVAG